MNIGFGKELRRAQKRDDEGEGRRGLDGVKEGSNGEGEGAGVHGLQGVVGVSRL